VELKILILYRESNLRLNIKEVARFSRQRQAERIVKTGDALAGKSLLSRILGVIKKYVDKALKKVFNQYREKGLNYEKRKS
jgi:hypothetical protein